jgi:hypothetical protein
MSLLKDKRAALRERIRAKLPFRVDGSLHLVARAWAVKGLALKKRRAANRTARRRLQRTRTLVT